MKISLKNIITGLLIISFILLTWALGLKDFFKSIEMLSYDWRARISIDKGPFNSKFSKADENIVLLSADNYTFEKFSQFPQSGIGRWPWRRQVWADVVNFVAKGNPKAIIFDIKFEGAEGDLKENKLSDNHLVQAISKNQNIILGTALSFPRDMLKKEVHGISQNNNISNQSLDKLIAKTLKNQSSELKDSLGFEPADE
ncbi:MAG: CHASE2 domain-containing protein, partial [Candidatus Gastranaerophilales bacterium]|nr:CHASE2 domain-containing protein [Candidatus Gastranaerophilales bacterium]